MLWCAAHPPFFKLSQLTLAPSTHAPLRTNPSTRRVTSTLGAHVHGTVTCMRWSSVNTGKRHPSLMDSEPIVKSGSCRADGNKNKSSPRARLRWAAKGGCPAIPSRVQVTRLVPAAGTCWGWGWARVRPQRFPPADWETFPFLGATSELMSKYTACSSVRGWAAWEGRGSMWSAFVFSSPSLVSGAWQVRQAGGVRQTLCLFLLPHFISFKQNFEAAEPRPAPPPTPQLASTHATRCPVSQSLCGVPLPPLLQRGELKLRALWGCTTDAR